MNSWPSNSADVCTPPHATATRLSTEALSTAALTHGTLADTIRTPGYARESATAGIVHLGIGAFHRAHQAVYFDDLLNSGVDGYAVIGASLRSASVAEQLNPQDGLYGVLTLDDERAEYRVIGAVREVLVADTNPAALLARLRAPETRIISLTVTEKGYCHRPSDGSLDAEHPDIRHDLAHPQTPHSALGFLMATLSARFASRTNAPVILCCDNLPHNGRLLAGLCCSYAEAAGDAGLAHWIEDTVRFPCTMVDRIVPATTDEDRAALAQHYGIDDHGLVKAEPFSQWVIEADHRGADARDGDDPIAPLGAVGALLVNDVAPFETMKLRLLNGAHSTLAYLGYLAGCDTIDRTMRLPGMDTLLQHLHAREIAPTLRVPSGFDLGRYQRELRQRFANAALRHRTWQIAMDGSQKLPQRLLGTVADTLAMEGDIEVLALAVAAWMRYVGGIDEHGAAIDVRDPLAARLSALSAAAHGDAAATVDALLGVRDVFTPELAADPRWRAALVRQYSRLLQDGARTTMAAISTTLVEAHG